MEVLLYCCCCLLCGHLALSLTHSMSLSACVCAQQILHMACERLRKITQKIAIHTQEHTEKRFIKGVLHEIVFHIWKIKSAPQLPFVMSHCVFSYYFSKHYVPPDDQEATDPICYFVWSGVFSVRTRRFAKGSLGCVRLQSVRISVERNRTWNIAVLVVKWRKFTCMMEPKSVEILIKISISLSIWNILKATTMKVEFLTDEDCTITKREVKRFALVWITRITYKKTFFLFMLHFFEIFFFTGSHLRVDFDFLSYFSQALSMHCTHLLCIHYIIIKM